MDRHPERYWSLLPMVLLGMAVLAVGLYSAAALAIGRSGEVPTRMTASLVLGGLVLLIAAISASHHLPASLRPAWFRDWQSRGSAEHEMVDWLQERQDSRRRKRGSQVHDYWEAAAPAWGRPPSSGRGRPSPSPGLSPARPVRNPGVPPVPSFRARLQIGDLLPGHAPEEVMDTAEAALATEYTVEAKDLEVVARVPRIVLRFTVPESTWSGENRAALGAAVRMRVAVMEVATTGRLDVLRRIRGRWEPVG